MSFLSNFWWSSSADASENSAGLPQAPEQLSKVLTQNSRYTQISEEQLQAARKKLRPASANPALLQALAPLQPELTFGPARNMPWQQKALYQKYRQLPPFHFQQISQEQLRQQRKKLRPTVPRPAFSFPSQEKEINPLLWEFKKQMELGGPLYFLHQKKMRQVLKELTTEVPPVPEFSPALLSAETQVVLLQAEVQELRAQMKNLANYCVDSLVSHLNQIDQEMDQLHQRVNRLENLTYPSGGYCSLGEEISSLRETFPEREMISTGWSTEEWSGSEDSQGDLELSPQKLRATYQQWGDLDF